MSRATMTPRPITSPEAAVLKRMIDTCATGPVGDVVRSSIVDLQVVSQCECGCDTVNFASLSTPAKVLADGVAQTPDGRSIGVIVFGTADRITCLEVYSYDDVPARLPTLESIQGY